MVQNEEVRKEFARRLKTALAHAGHAEWGAGARLAEVTGSTAKAASKWLNAESMPGRANMLSIAEWLGVRVEWLQYGEGEPRQSATPAEPARREHPEPARQGQAESDQAQALLEAVAALHVIQAGLLAGIVSKEQLQRLLQIRNEITHQKPGGADKGHRLQGLLAAAFHAEENGDSPDDLLKMYQLGMEKEFAKEGAAAHEPGKKPARRS